MAMYLPSAQEKKGDKYLDGARNLRDKWRDIMPRGDLTRLQNRLTMATEMRAELDSKRGFSKVTHARTYRRYAEDTFYMTKSISDRARDIASLHETYEQQQERVALVADAIYRSFFGYRDAFPTPDQESSWALSVWTMACAKTGTNLVPPVDLIERLARIGPRFHATVKERVTPLVARYCGFQKSKAVECLSHNIELARMLKTDTAFSNGDGENASPYRHRIVQRAINIIWFDGRSSDGVIFSSVFNPMPYEAIALVLAVIECCIDEWSDGTWTRIPFAYENYQEVYHHHLGALKDISDQSLDLPSSGDPLWGLRTDLFNKGRDHAGVPRRRSTNQGRPWPREKVDPA